jgi:hypothetical protein
MTDSIRERIVRDVVTAVEGITGYSGLTVERNRPEPATKFPALVVVEGAQTSDDGMFGITDVRLLLDVEGYVAGADAVAANTSASTLMAEVVRAVLADETRGGLAVDTRETGTDLTIDRGEGRRPLVQFTVSFEIRFFHRPGDPFATAP